MGLARVEFIITTHIGIHPMALVRYPNVKSRQVVKDIAGRNGSEYVRALFVRRLSEGIGRTAGRRSNDDPRGSAMNPPIRILVRWRQQTVRSRARVPTMLGNALDIARSAACRGDPYLADPSGIAER